MPTARSDYKDRLFSFIFGSPGNEPWTLALYNAVNATSYSDPSAVEVNTVREALYLGMRNDVSFLIADEMSLYEQQSTYNPNMPLRMLQYLANLYERVVVSRRLNKYGSRLIPLPVPKLVVFYNGVRELGDETVLSLADSFPPGADPDVSVRVRMVNVNEGRSPGLLGACRPLAEYSWLVARIRDRTAAGERASEAVDATLASMPEDFTIKRFLETHRAEVAGMLLAEYDEAKAMEMFREDGRAQGLAEGLAEGEARGQAKGRNELLAQLVQKGLLSPADAEAVAREALAERG